jgi:hypothetical protein
MVDAGKRITKHSGGDYTHKTVASFVERQFNATVSKEEIEEILAELVEDKVLLYQGGKGHKEAGYVRRQLPSL